MSDPTFNSPVDIPGRHRDLRPEPRWQPQQRFTWAQLPVHQRYWLLDDGSLSARLSEQGRGPFGVLRISQGWRVPMASERRLLAMPQRQLAIVREVVLQQGEHRAVFARSVIPLACLQGSLAHLRRLQNKPLGAILFRHAGMRRSPFELARIQGKSDYLPALLRQKSTAWGRRSRFEVHGHSMMVSEVFLEGFQPWPATSPLHRSQRGKVSAAIVRAKQ
jgi:chorismate--pyruvate lyase